MNAREREKNPSPSAPIMELQSLVDMLSREKESLHDAIRDAWDWEDEEAAKKAIIAAGGLKMIADEIYRVAQEIEKNPSRHGGISR